MTHPDFLAAIRGETRFFPTGSDPIVVRAHSAGTLRVTSGSIVACDPLSAYELEPFSRKAPLGEKEVTLAVADFGGIDQRVAAAVVRFGPGTPVRWEMAERAGEDASALEPGRILAYGVDAGTGCFVDASAAEHLHDERVQDVLTDDLERTYRSTWSWANVPAGDEGNVVAFSSGWGDGAYTSWWGLGESGRVLLLATDFGLLMEPVERVAHVDDFFTRPLGPIPLPELEPLGVKAAKIETPPGFAPGDVASLELVSTRSATPTLVSASGGPVASSLSLQGGRYSFYGPDSAGLPPGTRLRITVLETLRPMRSE